MDAGAFGSPPAANMAPAPPEALLPQGTLLPQGSLSLEAWQYSDVAALYCESIGERSEDEIFHVTGFPSFTDFAVRVGGCLPAWRQGGGMPALAAE